MTDAPPEDLTEHLRTAFREWEEQVDAEFGRGAWDALDRSLLALFLHPARGHKRREDLMVLARGLVSGLKLRQKEKAQLRTRAHKNDRSPSKEKVEVAQIGLTWAAANLRSPQRFRLGQSRWLPTERREEWTVDESGVGWLPFPTHGNRSEVVTLGRGRYPKGDDGKVILMEPGALPYSVRLAWYVAASKRATRLELMGKSWKKDKSVSARADSLVALDEAAESGGDSDTLKVEPTPLDAIIATEGVRDELRTLLKVASPRQREILNGLLERYRAGLSESDARTDLASDLGIAPATIGVHLHRLRQKVK